MGGADSVGPGGRGAWGATWCPSYCLALPLAVSLGPGPLPGGFGALLNTLAEGDSTGGCLVMSTPSRICPLFLGGLPGSLIWPHGHPKDSPSRQGRGRILVRAESPNRI